MIEILELRLKNEWLPRVKEALEKHKSILYIEPDLLVNQIIRGEVWVFNVNNDLIGIAKKIIIGNSVVFFVNFAYSTEMSGFFDYRKKLKRHLKEIVYYVKEMLGCDRMDLMCVTDFHLKTYKLLISEFKPVKSDYYVKTFL